MKKDFDFKNTKVGEKVYHVTMGWVTVNYNDRRDVEINECKMYNMDDREDSKDENPTIYP